MEDRAVKPLPAIGFLTVVQSDPYGLFGGYLVLNPAGRPLEFHCTAPVKPNRAQQILYGPTLEPFLYGQQIGQTLLDTAKQQPGLILTDLREALAIRDHTDVAVALLLPDDLPDQHSDESSSIESQAAPAGYRPDGAHAKPGYLRVGRCRLELPSDLEDTLESQLSDLADQLDLAEPFERIRQAIEEAQRVGKQAPAA